MQIQLAMFSQPPSAESSRNGKLADRDVEHVGIFRNLSQRRRFLYRCLTVNRHRKSTVLKRVNENDMLNRTTEDEEIVEKVKAKKEKRSAVNEDLFWKVVGQSEIC